MTISGGEQKQTEYKLDSKQSLNRETFHFSPSVKGNAMRFQVKSLSGNEQKAALGGHIAIYGSKKEEKKEEKNAPQESNAKETA